MTSFTAVDVIRVKRDGGTLPDAQIDWVIDAYTRGEVADEQMSALAMAILLNGMSGTEIARWTAVPDDRVLGRWRELSDTLGRRVRIDSTEGLAEDIGPHGELIVDGKAYVAGSVTHLAER